MKQYKHKKTGQILTMVKPRRKYSTLLVTNEPTRVFYNRTIPNHLLCNNDNLVEV